MSDREGSNVELNSYVEQMKINRQKDEGRQRGHHPWLKHKTEENGTVYVYMMTILEITQFPLRITQEG